MSNTYKTAIAIFQLYFQSQLARVIPRFAFGELYEINGRH